MLSVIVLTLDSVEYVGECLRSLPPPDERLEILVVDGGSCDGTVSLIQREFPGVIIKCAPGSTIPQARNAGLREATGRYVQFLDSDERVRWEGFRRLLAFLDSEGPSFVVADNARIDRHGGPAGVRRAEYPDAYGGLLRNPVSTLGMVSLRGLLISAGGFSEEFPVAEDYDLWLRVFEAARGRHLDVVLGEHRIHSDSASQGDLVRTRVFGARAALSAARRRRIPFPIRVAILLYWYLGILDLFHLVPHLGLRPRDSENALGQMVRTRANASEASGPMQD